MGSNFDLGGLFRDLFWGSGGKIGLPHCCKLAANRKNDNDVTIPDMTSSSIFWCRFFLLLSLVTGPSFISKSSRVLELWQFFFYKGLTRNSEIRNTPVWVWPNIWRLGPVRDTKFCKNVSNEMLLNAAKCQGYSFYGFWVIKGKPKGVGGKIKIPPQME